MEIIPSYSFHKSQRDILEASVVIMLLVYPKGKIMQANSAQVLSWMLQKMHETPYNS